MVSASHWRCSDSQDGGILQVSGFGIVASTEILLSTSRKLLANRGDTAGDIVAAPNRLPSVEAVLAG